jgi:hypothetical protein
LTAIFAVCSRSFGGQSVVGKPASTQAVLMKAMKNLFG